MIRVRAGLLCADRSDGRGPCGLPTQELVPLAVELLEVDQGPVLTTAGGSDTTSASSIPWSRPTPLQFTNRKVPNIRRSSSRNDAALSCPGGAVDIEAAAQGARAARPGPRLSSEPATPDQRQPLPPTLLMSASLPPSSASGYLLVSPMPENDGASTRRRVTRGDRRRTRTGRHSACQARAAPMPAPSRPRDLADRRVPAAALDIAADQRIRLEQSWFTISGCDLRKHKQSRCQLAIGQRQL